MISVKFHRQFEKNLARRLNSKQQERFFERLRLFRADPYHELLDNHPLKGKLKNYRSIDITGNIRAIYKEDDPWMVTFADIGTHSQLYG